MYKFKIADSDDVFKINSVTGKRYPVSSIYVEGLLENNLISVCVFTVSDDKAEIIDVCDLSDSDEQILLTNLKAAMNYVDLSGIKKVKCRNMNIKDLLIQAGFMYDNNDSYLLDLEGYFEAGCHH